MNVAQNYFAPYRYRPPMPLEDTSRHYYYCAPGGLPPLAPRKMKKKKEKTTRPAANNNNTSTFSTATTDTGEAIVMHRQQVHWPNDLNQHKQVVEFNKADAILACNIGSPFEGEWYYDSVEDLFHDSLEYEPRIPCWWEWDVLQDQFMITFPRAFYIFGLVYLFLVDVMAGEDIEWEDNEEGDNDINVVEEKVPHDDYFYFFDNSNEDDDDEEYEEEEYEVVREPTVDGTAPPEEQTQLNEALNQQEDQDEKLLDVDFDTTTDDTSFGVEDDEEEEDDDGSDYYFSLQSMSVSESAIDYFMSMGVMGEAEDDSTVVEDQELIATEIDAQEEDTMYVELTYDPEDKFVQEQPNLMETSITMEDTATDAEASKSIDNVSMSNECISGTTAVAALGSIWVPDPKHGLVRRSARLRARG